MTYMEFINPDPLPGPDFWRRTYRYRRPVYLKRKIMKKPVNLAMHITWTAFLLLLMTGIAVHHLFFR